MIQSPLKKKKNKIYEIFSDQFEIDGNQLIQINSRKIITDLIFINKLSQKHCTLLMRMNNVDISHRLDQLVYKYYVILSFKV